MRHIPKVCWRRITRGDAPNRDRERTRKVNMNIHRVASVVPALIFDDRTDSESDNPHFL